MKKFIAQSKIFAALLIGALLITVSCDEDFDKDGFITDVSVSIESFSVNGVDGDIDLQTGDIAVTLPYSTDVTALIPEIIIPEGATISMETGEPVDFTAPVEFRVTNGNIYKDYTVTVSVVNPILKFTINNIEATINNTGNTISITLPQGTDVTALQPEIELSEGVAISPASGETLNFTEPVVFTVSAGEYTEQYTATVLLPVEGLTVAFLGTAATKNDITNLDEVTAVNWMFDTFEGAQYISFSDIQNGTDLSTIGVIWWHHDAAINLPSIALAPEVTEALQEYLANGGNLLLTTFASQYVDALGIVPAGKGPNNVFGDFPPAGFVDNNSWGMSFVPHQDHPVFQGLETFEPGKANLLEGGTFRLNHTAWWFLPEWGGYENGEGWRNQTGGNNLASEAWDNDLNGRVTIAEWPGDNAEAINVIVISMGAYDWYNEADSNGEPSQPNAFINNIKKLTENSINYLFEN